MGMREKLIDLLHKGVRCPGTVADCTDCPQHSNKVPCDEFGATADMLIANDVVPVVRCKDCKHSYKSSGSSTGYRCKVWGVYDTDCEVTPDNFCAYGERKDNG